MTHEGEQITGIRDLTEDEVIGDFPPYLDTIPGLELETGNVIFPTGDEEGNMIGEWPVSRNQLEDYVGMYVIVWRNPNDPDERQVTADREPIHLVLGEESPTIHDDGEIEFTADATVSLVPHGRGAGPSAWHIRDELSEEERPDPETTPTPDEVMEMYESGEIESTEFGDRLQEAEQAHEGVRFAGIY